mgnify:FL=1
MKEHGISLRAAAECDMPDLLEWRNHPETRKSSFNTDSITPEAHEAWFKKKLVSAETVIYIAMSGSDKIGSARFEDTGEAIRTSVMLNQAFFGKRLGSKVIAIETKKYKSEKKPSKPLVAEIKTSNAASIRAFAKADFKESFVTLVHAGEEEKNDA